MDFVRRALTGWRALRHAYSVAVDDELQRMTFRHVRFGSGVLIRGAERITIGTGVFIDHRAYLSASSVNENRGFIRIGDHSEIGPYSVLWGGGGVEIGSNVHLGAHVHITSQQGRRVSLEQQDPSISPVVDCAPVCIGDHVLIYSGTIIVPGVTIGHHAVIGAGAVVIDDIPPGATAVGVPARIVRQETVYRLAR